MSDDAIIFEDDLLLARLITGSLSQIFRSVKHFETLAAIHEHRATLSDCPVLIWMDVRAPGNTPEQVFAEIRTMREQCPNSIIVVMSGMPLDELRQSAMDAGADEVAFKPFRTTALDLARVIAVGAINAMHRTGTNNPKVLDNVRNMAIRYFNSRK